MKIDTKGKDQIAAGTVYKADKDGMVEIPDKIAKAEGLNPKKKYTNQKEE